MIPVQAWGGECRLSMETAVGGACRWRSALLRKANLFFWRGRSPGRALPALAGSTQPLVWWFHRLQPKPERSNPNLCQHQTTAAAPEGCSVAMERGCVVHKGENNVSHPSRSGQQTADLLTAELQGSPADGTDGLSMQMRMRMRMKMKMKMSGDHVLKV